jgi:hypothetical protein
MHPSRQSQSQERPHTRPSGMRLHTGMRNVHAIYLGGNILRNDWRRAMVQGLGQVGVTPAVPPTDGMLWPTLPSAILGRFDYTGPYSISGDSADDAEWNDATDDEGSEWVVSGPLYAPQRGPRMSADAYMHGGTQPMAPLTASGTEEVWWPLVRTARQVQRQVIEAINKADLYFAWVDTPLCAATLTEAGWAAASGKVVWVAGPQAFDEMWLLYTLADLYSFRYTSPVEAFRTMVQVSIPSGL